VCRVKTKTQQREALEALVMVVMFLIAIAIG
jgi:hypothetical protein